MRLNKLSVLVSVSSIVGILLILLTPIQAYRQQEIEFYSDRNHTKKIESFFASELDLFSESIHAVGKNAKSHCIVRGLWKINGIFNFNPNLTFVEIANGNDISGRVCGSWNTVNQTAQYKSIQLVGAQDMDSPGLSLYVNTRFEAEELYFAGTYLRLPNPLRFNSFGFTGKDNWTIYPNTDFTGAAKCLQAEINNYGNFAVTFATNKSLLVGSIWRNCGDLSRSVVSPPDAAVPHLMERSGVSLLQATSDSLYLLLLMFVLGLNINYRYISY